MKAIVKTEDNRNHGLAAPHLPYRTAYVISLVTCAAALLAQPCFSQSTTAAQHSWEQMRMPTAAEVAKIWNAPPPEYGPEPYYGLSGPVTVESVAHDLDTMKSLGFRAVTVQAGRGMKQPYLSLEYFAFFKQFVAEAKKRDMRVWIVDDIGYPSGFAGGKFTTEKPELRMQMLAISQRLPVKAGATLNQAVGPNAVAAIAINPSGDRAAVPLTAGNINWTAPAGSDWTVAVVEHVYRTSPTRSDSNPTGLKDATQSLEDYMDPAATEAYIQYTHEGYFKAVGEEFGKTIMGFRGDEPAYSGMLPWTPAFFDTFQKIKGYDIRPYLGGIMTSQVAGGRARPGAPPPPAPAKSTDADVRAKGDYYDVFSQMFRDGFFKPQGVWCAAHGVEYQVHLVGEEAQMQLTRGEGDYFRANKYVEVPGIDTIWHQIWTDTVADFPRIAAGAAHVYGHPRAFTESFAAYSPVPDIAMARYILNEQMVRGINLIETMHYSSSVAGLAPPLTPPTPEQAAGASLPANPPTVKGGPSLLMQDPGYPALMDHVRRLSYVMSMGRPAATVALYIPSSSMWLGDRDSDPTYVSTERMLSERQIDFDDIGGDALATDLKAGPGTFETMSGNSYRTVIIPSASILSQAEFDRLRAFAKGGGEVLFLGKTPSLIAGRTILDAHSVTPADFSWATVETSAQLPPTPTPGQATPASPPGPLVVPAAIESALNTVIGPREVALDSRDTAVKVVTRRLKDANVYFFFNEGAQPVAHSVTLKAEGKTVELWDSATGSVSAMPSTPGKGAVTVKLNLKPYETELLTVR